MSLPKVGKRESARSPLRWALWAAPVRVIALVLTIEAVAAFIAARAIFADTITGRDLLRFGLLAGLSVAYSEGSRQVSIRRRFFAGHTFTDVLSVWTLSAALLLPTVATCAFAVAISLYMWFRVYRFVPTAKPHRTTFNCATIILSSTSAACAAHLVGGAVTSDLRGIATAVLAIAAYRMANLLLVSPVIVLSGGARFRAVLVDSKAGHALEFATLGLGAVTAASVLVEPWFTVAMLPAVFLLQTHTLMKDLVNAATVDAKTELLNADAWRQVAERELARAERTGADAAVLVIDMDHFKQINDTHGHLAGDAALKAVGEALADELRAYDAVGRFGGEEFVALLPTLDTAAASAVAERVRHRIATTLVPIGNSQTVTLTASIGVASHDTATRTSTLDDLLRAADIALYAAKAAGRNLVRTAHRGELRIA